MIEREEWVKPVVRAGYRLVTMMGCDGEIPVNRIVVCAATRYGETIVPSARHYDTLMNKTIKHMGLSRADAGGLRPTQGFIDQFGVFMDRREALAVAVNMGQVNRYRPKTFPLNLLFSEDLY